MPLKSGALLFLKPKYLNRGHDFLLRNRYCILISNTIEKPKCTRIKSVRKMKNLFYVLLFISIKSSAQDISGLYSGTLTNDSLKMIQNYELALSEYRGKITGYSYITFVSNDTFYYGIKRIKAIRENGELVVTDVEMLMNNYPQKADKGVHLINRIPLPKGDSILNLNGRWETTKTKKFYSISGALDLQKDNDSTHSPLIAHLKELKIINHQEENKNYQNIAKKAENKKRKEVAAENKETALKETKTKKPSIVETPEKQTVAVVTKKETPIVNIPAGKPEQKETKTIAETKPKEIVSIDNTPNPVVTNQSKTIENKSNIPTVEVKSKKTEPVKDLANTSVSGETNTVTQVATPQPSNQTIQEQRKTTEPIVTQTIKTQEAETKLSGSVTRNASTIPLALEKRVNNTIQTLTVTADSLVLSFYDNGVVDGDSISVYLNEENVISKVKLKEAAVKKTIYLNNPNDDEIRLTLVAENLGSIPPNTGLLIIQDGKERYQIRFKADMETNASVIIKKKKK